MEVFLAFVFGSVFFFFLLENITSHSLLKSGQI